MEKSICNIRVDQFGREIENEVEAAYQTGHRNEIDNMGLITI